MSNKTFNCGLGTVGLSSEEIGFLIERILKTNEGFQLIIDTAMSYNTEQHIGSYIAKHNAQRKRLFIIDKINFENQIIGVRKSLEKSLLKLNTDYIDLLCIHSPRYKDYIQTWKEMEKVKDAGLVKHIGLSNFYLSDIKRIMNITNYEIFSNQIPFCVKSKGTELIIDYCKDCLIRIQVCMIIKNIVANKNLYKILKEVSNKQKKTIYQVALTWIREKKMYPIVGTKKYNHFIDNNKNIKLSKSEIQTLNNVIDL